MRISYQFGSILMTVLISLVWLVIVLVSGLFTLSPFWLARA
ncbi:hypothetical protein [Paenibacillus ihumii]|nr:hypothetical protein [Paenibacillus ihumii]